MHKFRTWKDAQRIFGLQQKGLDLFLKDELPDSRSLVADIFTEKSIIDFEIYRSSLFKIIKERSAHKNNINT